MLREEHGNERLLPGVTLPEDIEITNDLTGAAEADIVLMAVPSFAVHSTAQQLSHIIPPQTVIVNVGKGLDRDNGYCRFRTDRPDPCGGGCARYSDCDSGSV